MPKKQEKPMSRLTTSIIVALATVVILSVIFMVTDTSCSSNFFYDFMHAKSEKVCQVKRWVICEPNASTTACYVEGEKIK